MFCFSHFFIFALPSTKKINDMRLTEKRILADLNGYNLRHNITSLKLASQKTAKQFKLNPYSVFRLVCFNEPIENVYTHSYGFHTAYGRDIIDTFTFKYNSL